MVKVIRTQDVALNLGMYLDRDVDGVVYDRQQEAIRQDDLERLDAWLAELTPAKAIDLGSTVPLGEFK